MSWFMGGDDERTDEQETGAESGLGLLTEQIDLDADNRLLGDEVPDRVAAAAAGRRPRDGIRTGTRSMTRLLAREGFPARVRDPNSTTDARARVRSGVITLSRRSRVRRIVLGVPAVLGLGDVAALLITFLVVGGGPLPKALFLGTTLIARAAARHYRSRLSLLALDDLPRTIACSLAGVGLTMSAQAVIDDAAVDPIMLLQQAGIFVLASFLIQTVIFAVARSLRRRYPGRGRRTLVIGGGRVAATLVDALFDHPDIGLRPVAVAAPRPRPVRALRENVPLIATQLSGLAETVTRYDIDTTILALEDGASHVDTVIGLHQTGARVLLVPSMFEMHHDGPDVERVRGIPLIRLRSDPTMRLSWWVKRSFDAAVAAVAITLLAVPMGLVALAILVDSGRPVLFWQERVGLDGRLFRLCKFRSMRPASEDESQTQWNIAKDPRVGKVGKLLRRTSVDELPQLWNILRGQMSLVGPRPERPGFVETFSREHERYWARHRVPVGLTGLAQVNGLRGDTSILERARYDNYYIANWSLWLDVKIMLLTIREVLGGRGR